MKVTPEDIARINEAYCRLKTYAATARELGFSPGTIKKYVIADYKPAETREIIRWDGDIGDFKPETMRGDFSQICLLTAEEIQELKVLWGELDA